MYSVGIQHAKARIDRRVEGQESPHSTHNNFYWYTQHRSFIIARTRSFSYQISPEFVLGVSIPLYWSFPFVFFHPQPAANARNNWRRDTSESKLCLPPIIMANSSTLPNKGPHIEAATYIFLILGTLAVALRFWARYISHKAGFWWDDWLSAAALVCLFPTKMPFCSIYLPN